MTDTPEKASISSAAMAQGLSTLRGLQDLHVANLEKQLLLQTEQIQRLRALDEAQKEMIAKQGELIDRLRERCGDAPAADGQGAQTIDANEESTNGG
ncbi:hypothetical protein [Nitratireductor sp. GCM10026969]|uniref:hypothetical protein n=1 Tax=Nitratireductor sp. GCM10026969 TaxID=3252645 RepID=UPI003609C335